MGTKERWLSFWLGGFSCRFADPHGFAGWYDAPVAGDDESPPRILDYHAERLGRNKDAVAKRVTGALASIIFAVIAVGAVIDPTGYLHLLGDDRRHIVAMIAGAATAFCLLVATGRIR